MAMRALTDEGIQLQMKASSLLGLHFLFCII